MWTSSLPDQLIKCLYYRSPNTNRRKCIIRRFSTWHLNSINKYYIPIQHTSVRFQQTKRKANTIKILTFLFYALLKLGHDQLIGVVAYSHTKRPDSSGLNWPQLILKCSESYDWTKTDQISRSPVESRRKSGHTKFLV